ncbi:hypothetical protein A1O7_02933 [Cladophialophora yegresii CBS 114405]|uniref:Uncharacterized protein n=1 Tax=Cladophialophora yegresii CBS 114405 TaxID=1182544 RepID=W9WBY7_9EURO|nr:uncharacterized protein A1O7_02933 [Cladophialophora yegresii CBS 114405]EXJ62495.1 hypothetical protein A1O7_02933 [Cladophialophora yegresii CBS 114405]
MDTSTPATSVKTAANLKSLQQMAAAKTLQALQEDENAVQTLLGLGEDEKQVLVPHLWQEFMRLAAAERKYQAIEEGMPAADRHIAFVHHLEKPTSMLRKGNGNDEESTAKSISDRTLEQHRADT